MMATFGYSGSKRGEDMLPPPSAPSGSARMRSVPAMPALMPGSIREVERYARLWHPVWPTAETAYCHAQALANADGIRRRVFKAGGLWRCQVIA